MISFILVLLLIIASIIDFKTREIPDTISVLMVVLGFGSAFRDGMPVPVLASLVGGGIFFLPLWLSWRKGLLGAGDVKLGAALGCAVRVPDAIYVLLFSMVGAGLIALTVVLFAGYKPQWDSSLPPPDADRDIPIDGRSYVPLGLAFFIGYAAILIKDRI